MMKTTAIKRAQIIGTVLFSLVMGGLAVQSAWTTSDRQRSVNRAYHPIAITLGALAPAVVFAPFVYLMFGRTLRRITARFKACKYCAETIKSEAKVCRYCGREVASDKKVDMQGRLRAEDDQRQPDVDANRAAYVQVPSATAALSDTTSCPAANEPGHDSLCGGSNDISELAAVKDDRLETVQQSALKAVGSIFLGIAAFLALVFLSALWVSGVLWVSEKIVWYGWAAADTAFWVCLVVLLPLSLFTATRKVSCFGIYAASFIFGLCTWMLGFLTVYEYWGGFGVFIGLVLGVVGIVPLGILASLFHADWNAAIFLTIGLMLTYCARSFAIWLAIKTDQVTSEATRVEPTATVWNAQTPAARQPSARGAAVAARVNTEGHRRALSRYWACGRGFAAVSVHHDQDRLRRISLPTRNHSAGRLAVCPVHPQLPRCRGPVG